MLREKNVLLLSLLIYFILMPLAYGQTEPQPPERLSVTSLVGRLAQEKHGQQTWLVLYATNTNTYLIKGDLVEELEDSLSSVGKDNLVSLIGRQDGAYNVSCRNSYSFDSQGNRKVDAKCVRYYFLEPIQLLEAKKFDGEIPPPKRDAEEEKKAMLMALSQIQQQGLVQTVTKEGVIESVNLKSPIKTIELAYRNKDNQPSKINLIVSPNTRIFKKIGEQEPIALSGKALKSDQKVTVVYVRDEFKCEALFITITGE